MQSEFVEIEVQACDFGLDDVVRHVLMGFNGLDGVTSDELALSAALAVRLEDVDGFDVVLDLREEGGFLLDGVDGVYDQASEEVGIGVDQLAGHGGLCAVEEGIDAQRLDGDGQLILDISACLLGGDLISGDDIGWMHFDFDELIGSLQ